GVAPGQGGEFALRPAPPLAAQRVVPPRGVRPGVRPPSLSAPLARRAGLVHLRQTFVLPCHSDDGWPPRAEAPSNLLFGGEVCGGSRLVQCQRFIRSARAVERVVGIGRKNVEPDVTTIAAQLDLPLRGWPSLQAGPLADAAVA